MNGPVILAAVVVVFCLLGQVRVGLGGEYAHTGPTAWARVGPVRLRLWPLRHRKGKNTGAEQHKKPVPPEEKKDKPGITPGGALDYARALLPIALEAAGQFRRKLQVDQLVLEVRAGAQDPADAAMAYGYANAALGALWLPLNQAFHIKDGTARVSLDFESESTTVYARGAMSLKIGQILWLGLKFGLKALRGLTAVKQMHKLKDKERKAV